MAEHSNRDEPRERELDIPLALAEQLADVKRRVTHLETLEGGGGSGKTRVQILRIMPPDTVDIALINLRGGGSTPAEQVGIWDFVPTTAKQNYLDFMCWLPATYSGGGLTFDLPWTAATATSGQTRWEIAIRRMEDDVDDIDVSHTYVYNGVSDTAASVSGELSYPQITFADGSDMDGWTGGEIAIVRVRRDPDNADDNMTGNAQLWGLIGQET